MNVKKIPKNLKDVFRQQQELQTKLEEGKFLHFSQKFHTLYSRIAAVLHGELVPQQLFTGKHGQKNLQSGH